MKWFERGPAPRELIEFRKTRAAEGAGSGRWDELPAEVLVAIRRRLFQAQRGLCCYCGRRLDLESRDRTHVEHVLPRSEPGVDPFEWTNLALACDGGNADGSPPHCDHAKGDQKLDYVDPFKRPTFDVTKLKSSGALGTLRPEAERDVVNVLRLNSKSLVDRRAAAVRAHVRRMTEGTWTPAICEREIRDLEQASRANSYAPWLAEWLRVHAR